VSAGLAILAAGGSTRAGTDKVSFELGGHAVLLWSIAAAEASAAYAAIVVVAPADRVAMLARIVGTRARVVAGGATRTASSWAGLDALAGHEVIAIHDAARPFASPSLFAAVAAVAAEYGSAVPGLAIAETVRRADEAGHEVIAIHDAARPFASPSLFAAVAAVAAEYGSAVPGLAIAETVRRADEAGHAIEEVDRGGLWTAQTPQAFRRTLLERARASAGDRSFTDDAAAVIAMNEDVRLVPGERRNFKLTSTEDLGYARELAEKGLAAISAQPVRP